MGEVYQAHDTKLRRDVAIKVLPEAFAHNSQRLARFQREAKLLASLNHTNVATIHDIEDSNGTSNLVMELVPGETLQARIRSEGAEGPPRPFRAHDSWLVAPKPWTLPWVGYFRYFLRRLQNRVKP